VLLHTRQVGKTYVKELYVVVLDVLDNLRGGLEHREIPSISGWGLANKLPTPKFYPLD
jgi:hypothetical protein